MLSNIVCCLFFSKFLPTFQKGVKLSIKTAQRLGLAAKQTIGKKMASIPSCYFENVVLELVLPFGFAFFEKCTSALLCLFGHVVEHRCISGKFLYSGLSV